MKRDRGTRGPEAMSDVANSDTPGELASAAIDGGQTHLYSTWINAIEQFAGGCQGTAAPELWILWSPQQELHRLPKTPIF